MLGNLNAKLGTNEHTNGRTDERKDENFIPLGINAGGIKSSLTGTQTQSM